MDLAVTITTQGAVFEGKTRGIIGDELWKLVQSSIMLVEREIKNRTPQGVLGMQGGLRGTIFSEMRGIPVRPVGVVAAPAEYAQVVEEGRRPGQRMPPTSALELWVEKVMGVPEEEVKGVAYVVARSIGRKGFKGAFMFRDGIKAAMPVMQTMFKKAGYGLKVRLEDKK